VFLLKNNAQGKKWNDVSGFQHKPVGKLKGKREEGTDSEVTLLPASEPNLPERGNRAGGCIQKGGKGWS